MSVQELARAADVSEATLVRFARSLGFEGYLELRAALTEEAKRDLLPEDRFAFEEPSKGPAGTAVRVARQEVENINRTLAAVEPKQLARFVGTLASADAVVTMGLGVSALLARLAAYALFQAGVRAEPLSRDVVTFVEHVERLPKKSALLVFAFPPYSKDTISAVQRASERHMAVLLVTDGAHSPLLPYATARLFASTENILFTNAISGPVMLINALSTELALLDKSRALRHLTQTKATLLDEYVEAETHHMKR
jgi:DNA-binding MurR/RpiR family transcriptional regulator